jgi:diguanylate cyclase (GGDEF)-like protein
MLALATFESTGALLWCGAAAVVLFALVGGFFAGVICAPWLQTWAIRRASAQIHKMYDLVMSEAERTHRLCAELARASGSSLSVEQCDRIDGVRRGFQEILSQIVKACRVEQTQVMEAQPAAKPKDFTVEWSRTPADPVSQLPDKRAFDVNLAAMLSAGSQAQLESGLLLVRMDKCDALRRRLGSDAVEKLLGRLVSLVVRSARDRDLVCRLSEDTLCLLCPALPPLAGTKVAEKIRDTVRNYHFRLEDGGQEVLVTASFGYANCSPADSPEMVRDRADDGLCRSQSLGRNQLHVHDGQVRALCRT